MMILPNTQEENILDWFLKSETLTLRLFSNDVIPDEVSIAADFTEVSGGGYAAINILVSEWIITQGGPTLADAGIKTFTFAGPTSAPGTVYGWAIVDSGGNLKAVERFPATVLPFSPVAGSQIKLAAVISAS